MWQQCIISHHCMGGLSSGGQFFPSMRCWLGPLIRLQSWGQPEHLFPCGLSSSVASHLYVVAQSAKRAKWKLPDLLRANLWGYMLHFCSLLLVKASLQGSPDHGWREEWEFILLQGGWDGRIHSGHLFKQSTGKSEHMKIIKVFWWILTHGEVHQ